MRTDDRPRQTGKGTNECRCLRREEHWPLTYRMERHFDWKHLIDLPRKVGWVEVVILQLAKPHYLLARTAGLPP